MENYRKGKNVEEELSQDRIPIEILPENFLWMHVKGGTKVSNVVDFAEKAFRNGEHRSVVWSGSGGGVAKTISCAEIMKKNFDLHQVTRLAYQKIEEYWDPILTGLDPIVVTRQVPAIHIFLTLDDVDPKTPGYQKAKAPTSFWPEPSAKQHRNDEDYVYRNKRNSYNNNNRSNNNNQRPKSAAGGKNNQQPSNSNKGKSSNNKKPKPEKVSPDEGNKNAESGPSKEVIS